MLQENVRNRQMISFYDLPDNILILFTKKFTKLLFKKLIEKFKTSEKARKFLRCSNGSFYNYINRTDFIPVHIIRKIDNISKINIIDLNKNLLEIKRRSGIPFFVKLPLIVDKDVAYIIGHLFGDGHIDINGRISYTNKNEELIKIFKHKMKKKFNTNPSTIRNKGADKKTMEIRYNSPIGDLFLILGCIQGNKIRKNFDIPLWIKNSSNEIKSNFIKALYDDEAFVSKQKSIGINLSKTDHKIGFLFFNSLKKILKELEIETNTILTYKYKTLKLKRERIKFILFITGRKNLENFQEMINFDHQDKRNKLLLQLSSYRNITAGVAKPG